MWNWEIFPKKKKKALISVMYLKWYGWLVLLQYWNTKKIGQSILLKEKRETVLSINLFQAFFYEAACIIAKSKPLHTWESKHDTCTFLGAAKWSFRL